MEPVTTTECLLKMPPESLSHRTSSDPFWLMTSMVSGPHTWDLKLINFKLFSFSSHHASVSPPQSVQTSTWALLKMAWRWLFPSHWPSKSPSQDILPLSLSGPLQRRSWPLQMSGSPWQLNPPLQNWWSHQVSAQTKAPTPCSWKTMSHVSQERSKSTSLVQHKKKLF